MEEEGESLVWMVVVGKCKVYRDFRLLFSGTTFRFGAVRLHYLVDFC